MLMCVSLCQTSENSNLKRQHANRRNWNVSNIRIYESKKTKSKKIKTRFSTCLLVFSIENEE
jgi:hypothetical protein